MDKPLIKLLNTYIQIIMVWWNRVVDPHLIDIPQLIHLSPNHTPFPQLRCGPLPPPPPLELCCQVSTSIEASFHSPKMRDLSKESG